MLFFLFLAVSFLPSLHAMSCVQTVNGTTYNLTSLHGLSDLLIIPRTGAYNYYMNVCGAVNAGQCANHTSAFACQVRKSNDQFEAVMAYSDVENHTPAPTWTRSTSTYGGVKLTFTNGDLCNLQRRILNIDFQCDINNTRSIEIYEMPQCTFNVIFPTNRTCIDSPSSSSSSTSSFTNSSSSSSSHFNSSSSTGPSPSNSSSTAGPSNSSSAIPIPTNSSSSSIPTNSSTSIPSNSSSSSSAIPTNSSTSIIPSNSSSTAIFSSSSIPSSESSGVMPPMSSTGHIDSSSTGTIPSKNEQGSTVTITGAGIGIGVLIGTSVTSALVLIWCCWDRSRRRSNPALSVNERQYTSLDA